MSSEAPVELTVDREAAIAWYRRNRARSRAIFDVIDPAAYFTRPIALRNPVVFYEGHLPAFSVIAFLRRGLGRPAVDARLEELFARGIDPDSVDAAVPRSGASTQWPTRDEVLAFGAAVDEAMLDALANAPLVEDRPAMRRAQGLFTALEHEAMHQETLLYMWHRLPYEQKRMPAGSDVLPPGGGSGGPGLWLAPSGARPGRGTVRIPEGLATLGADPDRIPFGWDNEFNQHSVHVAAFDMDVYNVTNGDFLTFVNAGGYRSREWWTEADWVWLQAEGLAHPNFWRALGDPAQPEWYWRGMFEDIPLPLEWPVYVSQAEAGAYARWKGRRLPTEAEWHRAAAFPSGSALEPAQGNFDFQSWEPVPVGSYAAGAHGVHDLVGNGWEWTSTVFAPFKGFEPMTAYPEYSAEFFDGAHYVIKGASPATARELVRPSFRNWFRPNYPYVYATFRTVE